jgi:hypothetical protein
VVDYGLLTNKKNRYQKVVFKQMTKQRYLLTMILFCTIVGCSSENSIRESFIINKEQEFSYSFDRKEDIDYTGGQISLYIDGEINHSIDTIKIVSTDRRYANMDKTSTYVISHQNTSKDTLTVDFYYKSGVISFTPKKKCNFKLIVELK